MTMEAASVTDTTMLRYLDAPRVSLARRGTQFIATLEGEASYLRVKAVRLFPLSEPALYVCLRGGDGKEIGVLVDPAGLDTASREALAQELHRTYILPAIQRIVAVKERFGTLEWSVITDRGPRSFTTRGMRETLVQPSPGRYLLTDVEGNRFDVPDLEALDGLSRAYLLQYT